MSDVLVPEGGQTQSGDRPIRFFDVFLAVIAAAAVSLIGGGLIGFAAGMLWAMNKLPGNPAEVMATDFNIIVGSTTVISALVLFTLYFVAKRFTKRPFAYFLPPVPFATLVKAAITAVIFVAAYAGLNAVLEYVFHISTSLSKAEEAMLPKTWEQFAMVLVCFVLFVPFYEEYLFRGFIFGWLKRVTPLWLAMAISAALFAAVHGLFISRGGVSGWIGTGELFVLGLLMAWWVARAKSLWPAYVVHIVNNAAAFSLAFFLPNLVQ